MPENSTSDYNKEPVGTNYSNRFFIVSSLVLFILALFLGYNIYSKTVKHFFTEKSLPADALSNEDIHVEIMNGCGVDRLTGTVRSYMMEKRIDVLQTGNMPSPDYDYSLVIDRTGSPGKSKRVAELLGLDETRIISQLNKQYLLDISIIIGRDFKELKPFMEKIN